MSKPFEHTITVRFADVDRAGIAYFNHVFHWCHLAYEEFLLAAIGTFDEAFGRSGWGTPMVRAEADFVDMIRHGDRLTARMTVDRIGGKSIRFAYELVRLGSVDQEDVRARVLLTHAFIDFATGKSIPMPEAFAEALKVLES